MLIRSATQADLAGIFAIYDAEALTGTATFDTEPYTPAQRRSYFDHHRSARHPLLVAELPERIAGYASLSPYSDRLAYARTAELSVYVHALHQRQGIGISLMQTLIDRARANGLGVLLSRITAESEASMALHLKLGFTHVGTFHRVGEKFGRLLDVALFELALDAAER